MSSNSLKHDEQRNVSPGVRGLHENVRGNFSNLWPGSDVSNLVGDVSGLYGMVFQDLCGCATGKNVNVSRLRSINLGAEQYARRFLMILNVFVLRWYMIKFKHNYETQYPFL